MKKCLTQLSAAVLAGLLVFCILPTTYASAADNNETTYQVQDLGDGFTVERTITQSTIQTYVAPQKSVSSSNVFKQDGVEIATLTLHVTFRYDGKTAASIRTSASQRVASGWNYTDHNIVSSGPTATMTGNLKKLPYKVPVYISLTCSPDGIVS